MQFFGLTFPLALGSGLAGAPRQQWEMDDEYKQTGTPWKSVLPPGNHPAAHLVHHFTKVILLAAQRIIPISFYNPFYFVS